MRVADFCSPNFDYGLILFFEAQTVGCDFIYINNEHTGQENFEGAFCLLMLSAACREELQFLSNYMIQQ